MPTTRKYIPKKKESKWKTRFRKGRQALKTSAQIATDVAKLSASVAYLGSRLNSEKKYKDRDIVTGHFGQVNANANGIYMIDVTPDISQGTDSDERIGNSLKLTGLSMPIQFDGMPKTVSARKIRVLLFSVRSADNGVNATECINDYFDVNPINGIIDMNSPRAYRKHVHDGIKLIRSKTYTLPKVPTVDFGNDDDVNDEEKSSFMAKFNVKLNDVLRYNAGGDSLPDGQRYFMFLMADKGNVGNSVSTLDVPVTPVSTGVAFRLGQRAWWVDN